MTPDALLREIGVRLGLSEGTPTLLLAVAADDAGLPEAKDLLLSILRSSENDVDDLGYAESAFGPARWAEATKARGSGPFALAFKASPSNALAARAFARLLNAERELLRGLGGPLLLFVSRETERDLRRHAPDFFTWVAHAYEIPGKEELAILAAKSSPRGALPAPEPPPEPPIRFLHLSDIHLRPQRVKRYDQDRVLAGLLTHLERDAQGSPLDLIFVTGDLAQSGTADEYALIEDFFRSLLSVTKVPRERVFVVPGNHDVDRATGRFLLRTLARDEDSIAFFEEARSRQFHAQKFSAYRKSMDSLLGEGRPHGLSVGDEAVEIVEIRGARIAVATFNSAWFAQGDDDQNNLWLGEPGVVRALDRIGDSGASFAIAMMHHPFDYLHEIERDVVERWMERGFDLVLRGHLHANKTRSIAGQRGGFVEVASPAAYQGSQWPNGCFLGEIRPLSRKIRLRPFAYASGPDPWVLDTKVFPDDAKDGYCREFAVPEKSRLPSSTARPLREAAQRTIQAASPAAQTAIAKGLEASGQDKGTPESAVRILSDSPELLTEVLGKEGATIALVQAIAKEAQSPEWQSRRVSFSAPGSFERALTAAAELFSKVASGIRSPKSERDIVAGVHAALSGLVDAGVWMSPVLGQRLRPDIVVGLPGAGGWIIEVRRSPDRMNLDSFVTQGLAQLDRYLSETGSEKGALIVVTRPQLRKKTSQMDRTPTGTVERRRTPADRGALLLIL